MTKPATPDLTPAKPPLWRQISPVWLVPILALAMALWLAWRDYAGRGQIIEIAFATADGIRPGETEIRFRNVSVGLVKDVKFTPDLGQVIVSAEMDPSVTPYLDGGARFWVVQPEISVRGVSGLDTVLSGAYIEGSWDADPGIAATRFDGLREAPLVQDTEEGLWVLLRTDDGNSITSGAPLLYRGVPVGYLDTPRLKRDGSGVIIRAFVESPHDQLITSATRFWDISGFSVSLGGEGLSLDVESLAALIEGGVAFDTVVSGGAAVEPGAEFRIFADQETARNNALAGDLDEETVRASAIFDGGLAGLSVGSDVRYKGVRVGQVDAITPMVARDSNGPGDVRLMATLALRPDRLGIAAAETEAFLQNAVGRGLHARLAGSGLLSTSVIVELVDLPDRAATEMGATPFAAIPTAPPRLENMAAAAGGLVNRISDLPIEELLASAIDLLDSLERLAASEETQAIPGATRALVDDARALVSNEAVARLPEDAAAAMASLNEILGRFREAEAAAQLVAAIEDVGRAAENAATASADLPRITADLGKLSAEAGAIPLADLTTQAGAILNSLDALVDQDTTRALPGELGASLASLRRVLDALEAGGVAENVASAADAVAKAARDLPALTARLDRTIRTVEGTISEYGEGARFNAEAVAMMRDIRAASSAVEQLARLLQRNPNAILTGR